MGTILTYVGLVGFIVAILATGFFIYKNDQKKFISSLVVGGVFALVGMGGLVLQPEVEDGEIDTEEVEDLELDEEVDQAEDELDEELDEEE